MDVDNKEAFKLGFLTRCAEEGLAPSEVSARLTTVAEKIASAGLAGSLFWRTALPVGGVYALTQLLRSPQNAANVVNTAASGVDLAGRGALALGTAAAGAGLLGGGALGYGAAKLTEPNVTDEDIKKQELAETYRIYAERAKAKRRARRYRPSGV
jgi:hypothetical protein